MRLLHTTAARRLVARNIHPNGPCRLSRSLHSAKADLTTLDSKGSPTTKQIDIFIGNPGQTYLIFSKDVGHSLKAGIAPEAGSDPDKVPLKFFHASRHFANNSTSYPRLTIPQDMPQQNKTDVSLATLWLCGVSHSITLDGTDDHKFEESARESYSRLKGAFELLKDR